MMPLILTCLLSFQRFVHDHEGQDLIEYALMAGFVAVAAAALFPQEIAPAIRAIFTKVGSDLSSAAAQGG